MYLKKYITTWRNISVYKTWSVSVFGPDSLELQLRQETMVMPKRPSGRPKSVWPKGCRCGLPGDSQSVLDGIWRNCKGTAKGLNISYLIKFFNEVNAWRGSWAAFWMLTRQKVEQNEKASWAWLDEKPFPFRICWLLRSKIPSGILLHCCTKGTVMPPIKWEWNWLQSYIHAVRELAGLPATPFWHSWSPERGVPCYGACEAYKFARRIEPEMPPLVKSLAATTFRSHLLTCSPIHWTWTLMYLFVSHYPTQGPLPPSGLSPRQVECCTLVSFCMIELHDDIAIGSSCDWLKELHFLAV